MSRNQFIVTVFFLFFSFYKDMPSATADISLVDKTETALVLKEPAKRVISLAPHITELVFSLGAGDSLVGVVSYSDFPEQALAIPRVGSFKKVSYETIAAMKPDLILSFGSGNGWDMINHLRLLGFKVYVDEPKKLQDVAKTLENYGRLLGKEDVAKDQSRKFRERYQALGERYQGREIVRTFYQVWSEPLITINNEHLIADVVRLCGGENIFRDAIPLIPKISVETVIRRNPAVIVASGMGEARPKWLDDWLPYTSINAVKHQQLYFVPPDLLQRHSVRILDGAEMMCGYLDQARHLPDA